MSTLQVALAQMDLRAEASIEQFLDHVRQLAAAAAGSGADLLVLPELASTGLLGSITGAGGVPVVSGDLHAAYWEDLPRLFAGIEAAAGAVAAEHGLTLLAGSHMRRAADGSLRNTAVLAHPDGRLERQDKLHLTPQEHDLGVTGGDDLLVTQVGGFTVGVLICADIQFPELSRHLVDRGVDLVLNPSLTWNRRGAHRVQLAARARAMENQVYVAVSTLVGSSGLPADRPLHGTGQALVAGPVDRVVGINDGLMAHHDDTGASMLTAGLERDLLLRSRERPETPGLALRRPDLYERLRTTATEVAAGR